MFDLRVGNWGIAKVKGCLKFYGNVGIDWKKIIDDRENINFLFRW